MKENIQSQSKNYNTIEINRGAIFNTRTARKQLTQALILMSYRSSYINNYFESLFEYQ